MAQKSILCWVVIPNRQEIGSDETEPSDSTAFEPSTEPGQEPPTKKKSLNTRFRRNGSKSGFFSRSHIRACSVGLDRHVSVKKEKCSD